MLIISIQDLIHNPPALEIGMIMAPMSAALSPGTSMMPLLASLGFPVLFQVSPCANIISYLVCFPSCYDTGIVAATEQALDDGVDVLNYSISGGDDPWDDPVDLAFLEATAAGMFVSTSAGNDGPGASTVAHTGPWNAAVAASTQNRSFANDLSVIAPTAPVDLQNICALRGENVIISADVEAPIKYDPDNNLGCEDFDSGFLTIPLH